MSLINYLFKSKENKNPVESHVVLTDSVSGETMIHIWRGDNIDNAESLKLNNDQAIKLKTALVGKFGV